MERVVNFSAGPATLPEEVLSLAAQQMLDWNGSGQSVMEMSHRGADFMQIFAQAEADFRELMCVPENYHVLFLQGGASLQFEMVPMNLAKTNEQADYICTGAWSKKAIQAAAKWCGVNVAASSESDGFNSIPDQTTWAVSPDAAYLHYTANETIGGVEFPGVPDIKSADVPLVCDMSSSILSQPVEVGKYGVIYAGAQKNIGPSGLTIVIVREDLVGRAQSMASPMLDYKTHVDAGSMYNTPPTYAIYIAGLVFQWLKQQGGVAQMAARNAEKSALLYNYIDSTDFYQNPVRVEHRSCMNVPFTIQQSGLDEEFLKGAKERGMVQLKGHRSVGGMRASIYNAMPVSGVQRLLSYMKEFSAQHGD